MIRIVIAEENAVVRWALREAFAEVPDMHVVGVAATVDETVTLVESQRPDVALLDVACSDAALARLGEATLVVVFGLHATPADAARVIAAGVRGFIPRSSSPEELLAGIRAVGRGERVIPAGALETGELPHPSLTPRELQVMQLLGRGMSTREVAAYLGIKVKTVDTHRAHIFEKLAVRNASELTRYAVKHGYAPL